MSIIRKICKFPALFGAVLLAAGCATPVPPGLEGAGRVRAFGPFYEDARHADGSGTLAVRPFYCRTRSTREPHREVEWLWPLASQRDGPNQRNWRLGVWFGTDYDRDNPQSKERVWLLPFWFHGRNAAGEPYYALFPFYGHINPFVGMDRSFFVLFPLYVRHQVNDIENVGLLWPVFTRTFSRERDIHGVRVFPFYGYLHRDGAWTRHFALWPLWTSVRFDESGPDSGQAWMLFPLVGKINTSQQQGWYFLPPFWSDIRRHAGDGYRRRHLPWPFVQLQDGTIYRRIYWPFWGTRQTETRRSVFFLWPFWLTNTIENDHHRHERRRLTPFWDDGRTLRRADGVEADRYIHLWPLLTLRREGDQRWLRVLSLWPGLNATVDRNWAPFWTLYQRREREGGAATDALWGLWRTRRAADGSRAGRAWPLYSWRRGAGVSQSRWLGGLFGMRQDDAGTAVQLAYFFELPRSRDPEDRDPPPTHGFELP